MPIRDTDGNEIPDEEIEEWIDYQRMRDKPQAAFCNVAESLITAHGFSDGEIVELERQHRQTKSTPLRPPGPHAA